jgi:hypothetical protein
MNTTSEAAKNKKKVPIFLFETNQNLHRFEQLDFELAQSEDERIAVDHVTKAVDPHAKNSSVTTNLESSVNALKLLRSKILFLIDIFQNSNEVRTNPSFTRRLGQICSQIQMIDHALSENENDISSGMYSDLAAINLLSTATKGFQDLQDLLKDIQVVNKGGRGSKPFGNIMMNQQEQEFE